MNKGAQAYYYVQLDLLISLELDIYFVFLKFYQPNANSDKDTLELSNIMSFAQMERNIWYTRSS